MKIKCIILTILFCAVSSSAFAWSRPWVERVPITPRASCEVVTLLPFYVADGFCCGSDYLLDASLRLTCLKNNAKILHTVNRVVQEEFIKKLPLFPSSYISRDEGDGSCALPLYRAEPPENQISGWINAINCEKRRYDESATEFQRLIDTYCSC